MQAAKIRTKSLSKWNRKLTSHKILKMKRNLLFTGCFKKNRKYFLLGVNLDSSE